jgi:hypothetical protein
MKDAPVDTADVASPANAIKGIGIIKNYNYKDTNFRDSFS